MNQFTEAYQKEPNDILSFIKEISSKRFDVKIVSDFCEAEYNLCSTFEYERRVLDISGTGGTGYQTINVGTISAFILASLGIPVAKLSFPSYSGSLGSADILKRYNMPIRTSQKEIFEDLDQFNLCFLQREYGLEGLKRNKKIAEIVNMMPQKSIFRLLGPLCHPLRPDFRVYGISQKNKISAINNYLRKNTEYYLLVSGRSGIDEVDICDSTDIWEKNEKYSMNVEDICLKKISVKDIEVDSSRSKKIFIEILENRAAKPFIDLVLINVAAGIKVIKGDDWEKGYKLAKDELKSGRPLEIFKKMSLFDDS